MECSFRAIDSSPSISARCPPCHTKSLVQACAKIRSLEEENKLKTGDVFELDLSFNELTADDMGMVHDAVLQCPKLVVHVFGNRFSWPELQRVMSEEHLRLWTDERISMASRLDHDFIQPFLVYEDEDMQHGSQVMNECVCLEDAVRAAVVKAYKSQGYRVEAIAYTLVYGYTGKVIYTFDFAYAAHKPGTGEKVLLLGQIKSGLSRADVEDFLQKVAKLSKRFHDVEHHLLPEGDSISYAAQLDLARPLLCHTVVKFLTGWHMLPEATSEAKNAGCHLVAPDGAQLAVYCSSDIDEELCHHLAPPPLSFSDEV